MVLEENTFKEVSKVRASIFMGSGLA